MNVPPPESLSVRTAELIHPQSGWPEPRHAHAWNELVLVTQGTYAARTPRGTLELAAGRAVWYPPRTQHHPAYETAARERAEYLLVQWTMPPGSAPRQEEVVVDGHGRLLTLLRWMWEVAPATTPEAEALHRSLLHAALWEVETARAPEAQRVLERVNRYIRRHYREPITLDQLARAADVSRSHLHRIVKKQTDLSPMRYLRRVRVDRAVSMLLSTREPLKRIAPRVGAANAFHLSRWIKQETGLSPRELRRRGIDGPAR